MRDSARDSDGQRDRSRGGERRDMEGKLGDLQVTGKKNDELHAVLLNKSLNGES